MFSETTVSCPLCGESATFVHTYKEKPTFGGCEACGYLPVLGYSPRGMIEHRRPKTVTDWDAYDPNADKEIV